ncbi:MAG: DUF4328 domain-containing protein [Tepidisphaeraceae bacterium]
MLSLGAFPERSAGWAVGSWFVPFVNLVVPFKGLRDVLDLSDMRRPAGAGLVGIYWTMWLLSGLLGRLGSAIVRDPDPTLDQLKAATVVNLLADLSSVAAAVLAILVIRAVNTRQLMSAASQPTRGQATPRF